MDTILSSREAAIDLIWAYVERGDSIESLIGGYLGCSCDEYCAQIGGYTGELQNLIKVKSDEIVVSKINGQIIELQIFSLQVLINEIKSGVKQPALF